MANAPQRPVPQPSPETERFWQGCKLGELWLPYCLSCQQSFFYPRSFCPRCFGWDLEWRQASGRGKVYTYAIQYRSQVPGLQAPYVTAIIQLDEGPRMMTNLIDVEPDPEHVHCDMPVEVTFQELSDEISLPLWRPAGRKD